MNEYNFTGVLNASSPLRVDASALIKDYVLKIDDKIILAVLLIFSGYFLYALILPRAKKGLVDLEYLLREYKLFSVARILGACYLFIDFLISFSETLALGGACFIFAIAYYQGLLSHGHLVWAFSLLSILFLLFIVEAVGFFRSKKHFEFFDKIKKVEVFDDEK